MPKTAITVEDALDALSSGHSIWKPAFAKKVCDAVGVPWNHELVQRWKSDPPGTVKGLTMAPGQENSMGVYSLSLSAYVHHAIGAKDAGSFLGRGFQAQAYARAIRERLVEVGKIKK